MYIEPDELKTSMYAHVIKQVTKGDDEILEQQIAAAIEEVRGYLKPRYNTDTIFGAEGDARNAMILAFTKVVTVWNLIQLSNAEMIYDMWKDRYDRVTRVLRDIANGVTTPELPLNTDENGKVVTKVKMGSNRKFRHSY